MPDSFILVCMNFDECEVGGGKLIDRILSLSTICTLVSCCLLIRIGKMRI